MNWGLVMIDDIADELISILKDYAYGTVSTDYINKKFRLEIARYAVAALMDSSVALEAEQFLAKENNGCAL